MFLKCFYNSSVWKRIAAVSIVLMLVTSAPYLYGLYQAPAGGVYTGLHALTPGDFNVYFTQVEFARRGDMASVNPYAGVDGIGSMSMVNPFWWILGKMAGRLSLSAPLVFHLSRLLLIPLLVWVLHELLTFIVPSWAYRIAGLMVLAGSGIGFLLLPFLVPVVEEPGRYVWPTDLWVPESNTFLTLYHSPHLLASLMLFLLVLLGFLKAVEALHPFRWQLTAGLAAAVLVSFHPFHLPTLGSILAAWTIILKGRREKALTTLIYIGLIAFPVVWWQAARTVDDWVMTLWAWQNVTHTPPLWTIAMGYGFLIPLAVWGVAYWRRRFSPSLTLGRFFRRRDQTAMTPYRLKNRPGAALEERGLTLIIVWVVVQFLLVESPLLVQRRLLEGLHVPLAILAGVGLVPILERVSRWHAWKQSLAGFVTVVLIGSSTLGTVSRDIALFFEQEDTFYLSRDFLGALDTLASGPGQGVVLAGPVTANYVPAWSGRVVYGAPGGFSPLFEVVRRDMIEWFLQGKGTHEQRRRFLQRERVSEVAVARRDGFNPLGLNTDPLLTPRFIAPEIIVYGIKE